MIVEPVASLTTQSKDVSEGWSVEIEFQSEITLCLCYAAQITPAEPKLGKKQRICSKVWATTCSFHLFLVLIQESQRTATNSLPHPSLSPQNCRKNEPHKMICPQIELYTVLPKIPQLYPQYWFKNHKSQTCSHKVIDEHTEFTTMSRTVILRTLVRLIKEPQAGNTNRENPKPQSRESFTKLSPSRQNSRTAGGGPPNKNGSSWRNLWLNSLKDPVEELPKQGYEVDETYSILGVVFCLQSEATEIGWRKGPAFVVHLPKQ